jgi:hypothetical protein
LESNSGFLEWKSPKNKLVFGAIDYVISDVFA